MKRALFLFMILFPFLLFSYTWTQHGPENIEINSYLIYGGGVVSEVICTQSGIMLTEAGDWVEYSYGSLPCWEATPVMGTGDDLLVVMGNGSESDGIYGFDKDTDEFSVYRWLMNPRFIKWCPADTSFYAGGEEGLVRSADGQNWENVDYFNSLYCYDMVCYDDHYCVSAGSNTYYSSDAGANWSESTSHEHIWDMEYDQYGTLYGVFPDESWSSGLWSSQDHGATWTTEFWSPNLKCVGLPIDGYVFTGWNTDPGAEFGFAVWHPDIEELEFCNEGLDNYYINQITTNPLINTPNALCCTDNGLWMLTNFTSDAEPSIIEAKDIALSNYPNPFNPETTISYMLDNTSQAELVIYDLKGRTVKMVDLGLLKAGKHQYRWNGTNDQNMKVASGVYLYRLNTKDHSSIRKMILMK